MLIDDFVGEVITPESANYQQARTLWNANVDKRPAVIARCAGAADVVSAIRHARANNLEVSIRGGGHNVGGRALCDGGFTVDMSRMRAVHVDPSARLVTVQGGVTLGDLDRETHLHGLAVPTGTVPGTGVAGLTLGGGVGFLVRHYGMTIDNLRSCQVVTATGDLLVASESSNPDLFWALRGGGGNFGAVTSFTFQAHPVSHVLGGLLIYPRPMAFDVLRHFRDFMRTAPDELTTYAALLTAPDGAPIVGVIPVYSGDLDQGARVIESLRKFGPPVVDGVQVLPHPVMQAVLGPSFGDGAHNYWKASMMETLPDDAIKAAIDQANSAPSPLSAVVFEYYGGAAGRVPNDATAFAHRHLHWDVLFLSRWTNAAETPLHRQWARDAGEALRPFSAEGQLLAALDYDASDPAVAFGSNYPRLAAIKAKYDPTNFFHVNQNIRPALS